MTRLDSAEVSASAADDSDAPARRPRRDRRTRAALWALAGVALLYGVVQLVMFDLGRPVSWDEVVYLAQTTPSEIGMDWGPQRARGIAWLVAPIAWTHPSFEAVRAYMIAVSSIGLFAAFVPWTRSLGVVAVLAAAVFGFSWVGLYFGMEVFPNLPAAFAAIATGGAMADWALHGRRRSLFVVALGIALVALFRPVDSVWLAAALAGGLLLVAWRRVPSATVALGVGGVVGWAPWLLEMGFRYGGVFAALDAARAESASGLPRNDIHQYLNLVEGPVRLIVEDPTLTYRALAGLALLAAFGLASLGWRRDRRVAVVAVAGTLGGVLPYVVLNSGVNLRYLLPAWGLGAVAVAIGAASLWRAALRSRPLARAAGAGALLAVAVVWLFAHGYVANRNASIAMVDQLGMYLVAEELAEEAGDGPCAFVSEYGYPQMSWATRCIGLEMDVYGETGQCPQSSHSLRELSRRGYAVFALAKSDMPDGHPLSDWPWERSRVRGWGRWRIAEMPPGFAGTDNVPRAPRPGEHSVPCPLSRAPDPSEIEPLRVGPRGPDDKTLRWRERRRELGQEPA